MNIKTYFDKHNNRTLQDDEWETLAESLIKAKFDREKKAAWTKKLSEKGIYRSNPTFIKLQSSNFVRKYMAAAAALLVLMAASWFFFLRSPLSSVQRMASHYLAEPFRLNQGNTRGAESVEKNRGKASVAFEMKKYEQSLDYLRIIESEGEAKAPDYFQMGLCLMYQKTPDYSKAIDAFNLAQKLDPKAYSDEINWFAGLCSLMKGDTKSAKDYLEKVIASPSSRNQDAARELLGKIR